MRRLLILLIGAFILSQPVQNAAFAASESIAAVVNEDAISQSDVEARMELIMRSSSMPDTEDIREKLRPQILNVLIEEQLKLQEAARLEQVVEQEEIDQGFAQIARQNNAPADKFKDMIVKSGVNIDTMYRQIESQIAWGKVIQSYIRPQINVSEADVQDAMQRMKDNIGKTEYLVAEIFLPVDDAKSAREVRGLVNKLSEDLKAKRAPFFQVAQQFSKSAGATDGGNLGWVQESQIEPELAKALAGMSEGEISDPLKTRTGYHILLLREQREITEDTLPSREGMLNDIGTERLERMQRRHLQDLKAEAFIEHRV